MTTAGRDLGEVAQSIGRSGGPIESREGGDDAPSRAQSRQGRVEDVEPTTTDEHPVRYNQNLWMHHLTEGATYLPL